MRQNKDVMWTEQKLSFDYLIPKSNISILDSKKCIDIIGMLNIFVIF